MAVFRRRTAVTASGHVLLVAADFPDQWMEFPGLVPEPFQDQPGQLLRISQEAAMMGDLQRWRLLRRTPLPQDIGHDLPDLLRAGQEMPHQILDLVVAVRQQPAMEVPVDQVDVLPDLVHVAVKQFVAGSGIAHRTV